MGCSYSRDEAPARYGSDEESRHSDGGDRRDILSPGQGGTVAVVDTNVYAHRPTPTVSFDTLNATLDDAGTSGRTQPAILVEGPPSSTTGAAGIVSSAVPQQAHASLMTHGVADATTSSDPMPSSHRSPPRSRSAPRLSAAALEEHTRREILLLHERITVGGPMVMGQPRDWREVLEQWAMGVVLPSPGAEDAAGTLTVAQAVTCTCER